MCETGNGRLGHGSVRADLLEGEVVVAAEREGRHGLGLGDAEADGHSQQAAVEVLGLVGVAHLEHDVAERLHSQRCQ